MPQSDIIPHSVTRPINLCVHIVNPTKDLQKAAEEAWAANNSQEINNTLDPKFYVEAGKIRTGHRAIACITTQPPDKLLENFRALFNKMSIPYTEVRGFPVDWDSKRYPVDTGNHVTFVLPPQP